MNKLLRYRKQLYTIRGCCSVDPIKLLLSPYMQLCIVLEQLDMPQDALRLCDFALSLYKDASLINVEEQIYPKLQRSQHRGQITVQLAAHFKKLLIKAKTIALKCGD